MSEEFEAKVAEVTKRYQPEIDQLEAEGKKLADDPNEPNAPEMMIGIDFGIEWKNRSLSFNVPTVTMKNKTIALDLPKIEKNRSRIVFDVPTVTMETYCAFKKPVVRWPKVTMECVYLDKPVLRMKKHEIVYDLPSVRMERKEFVLKVPQFGSERREIIVKLPEFTAKNTRVEVKRLVDRGRELKERGEALAARMEAEIKGLIASFFGGVSDEAVTLRHEVENGYNGAIGEVEASIAELGAQKIDASKVPAENGNVNLRKVLSDLIDQRTAVVGQIDQLATA